ncbi:hypothetical protein [Stappia sp. MMSF_3263]|uniref:hypothetical protein n=1 Tax=Stappia sp. MMSF_3263 TaxID=3046693 RepID=UPI00273FA073|nr:hypothetical protein [Stappia sp. MMSF_3263]
MANHDNIDIFCNCRRGAGSGGKTDHGRGREQASDEPFHVLSSHRPRNGAPFNDCVAAPGAPLRLFPAIGSSRATSGNFRMMRSKKHHMEFLFHFCFHGVKLKSASRALRREQDAAEGERETNR